MAPKPLPPLPNWWSKFIRQIEKAWRNRKKPVPKPPVPPVPPPPKPKPKPRPRRSITMYDTVTPTVIPSNAKAVAGYIGGHWPTFGGLAHSHPNAHRLSIAVTASEDADCLDVEKGDASPGQAPAWIRRQHARGKKLPVVYTSAAYVQGLVDLLAKAGLVHGRDYKVWSAHYTFKRHRCSSKCGFGIKITADATQYNDKALGRNLDVSVCAPDFFT